MFPEYPEYSMAAFVCKHVAAGDAVRVVARRPPVDEVDSGWCFDCGSEHETDDWMVVAVFQVFDLCSEMRQLFLLPQLALPEGYWAYREGPGSPWVTEPYPDEAD
jgi:hypothetical protein